MVIRNYFVSKQGSETIKEINISSLWGSSQWRNSSLTGLSSDCWYEDFYHMEFKSLRIEFHRRIWRRRRRFEEFEVERRKPMGALKNLKKKEKPQEEKNPQEEEATRREEPTDGGWRRIEEEVEPMEEEDEQRTN